jgi:hypothetical protein
MCAAAQDISLAEEAGVDVPPTWGWPGRCAFLQRLLQLHIMRRACTCALFVFARMHACMHAAVCRHWLNNGSAGAILHVRRAPPRLSP